MVSVVVVGGGVAGAGAAVRLAKLGHVVTLLERRDRVGGAVGLRAHDGFRWDTGPAATALPAVVRDLFRKSGRPLERELDLVPQDPMREHRFADGTRLALPSGSRAAQLDAVSAALGAEAGRAWVDHVHSYAVPWDVLRRQVLERPWSARHADPAVRELLGSRTTLHRAVRRGLRDPRLRAAALAQARLEGHDPRRAPAWLGVLDYVEQNFGTWTVPGGMGLLADALTARLAQRRVTVELGVGVDDVVVRGGRVVAVSTAAGPVDADVVICAVDPRVLPTLAAAAGVRRTTPTTPPAVWHLGLAGPPDPRLAAEVVLHGDPLIVVRTGQGAPPGRTAWTVLVRGRAPADVLAELARRGLDVRDRVLTTLEVPPASQVAMWGGSPYGVRWQGRASMGYRLGGQTPLPGAYAVGAHVAGAGGLPFALLTAAVVAERLGRA